MDGHGPAGIEHRTVFGLPPVEFVNLAADLGCRYIAIALSGSPYNPHGQTRSTKMAIGLTGRCGP
jgi:hypothetical protein